MNQFYRALHMPVGRLVRKLTGEKEIYTIAVRPLPGAEGVSPLPALGGEPYTPLPETPGVWYADPLLYRGVLFCEAFDMATGHGDIAVAEFDENGRLTTPRVVLHEPFHLSFPTVFDWNGRIWMIPETGSDHSLTLYRCTDFPDRWEKVQSFPLGGEYCDTILLDRTPGALTLLCSETKPENQLYVRWRRCTLRRTTTEDVEGPSFVLEEDETFDLQNRTFDLTSRNAGPLFLLDGQVIHPTQVSTEVDYGVYLQFLVQRGASEVPLCAATPQNVVIEGIPAKDIIGIHTYCRDDRVEVIDARYLKRVAVPARPNPSARAKPDAVPDAPLPVEPPQDAGDPTGEAPAQPEGPEPLQTGDTLC